MRKVLIVARREFIKVVRKPSFWISTLLLPTFIVFVGFISGFSSVQVEESIKKNQEELRNIVVNDRSGLINPDLVTQFGYTLSSEYEENIQKVRNEEISGFFYYPENILETKKYEIYAKDLGLFGNEAFSNIADTLIKNSALAGISDPNLLTAFNTKFDSDTQIFNNGEVVEYNLERFIVPILAVIIYFVLTTFAVSFLLLSVSEEKENRAIEIVLSAIKPKQLIFGKIIGLIGVVLTQVLILLTLSAIVLIAFQNSIQIPINFSEIQVNIFQVIAAAFYAFMSFFLIACTMVGVGAAMPNYKDANSFSSIFILVSVIPLYFVTAIIADPSGPLSIALSYVPFANGIVLVFRSTFGALNPVETILSAALMIVYATIALFIAFKLFEFGSLEYGRKISAKDFLSILRKNKRD